MSDEKLTFDELKKLTSKQRNVAYKYMSEDYNF